MSTIQQQVHSGAAAEDPSTPVRRQRAASDVSDVTVTSDSFPTSDEFRITLRGHDTSDVRIGDIATVVSSASLISLDADGRALIPRTDHHDNGGGVMVPMDAEGARIPKTAEGRGRLHRAWGLYWLGFRMISDAPHQSFAHPNNVNMVMSARVINYILKKWHACPRVGRRLVTVGALRRFREKARFASQVKKAVQAQKVLDAQERKANKASKKRQRARVHSSSAVSTTSADDD